MTYRSDLLNCKTLLKKLYYDQSGSWEALAFQRIEDSHFVIQGVTASSLWLLRNPLSSEKTFSHFQGVLSGCPPRSFAEGRQAERHNHFASVKHCTF